ncbi:Uncharacterised protein [Vibrio cholerae]|nr:Uncharacterised protein [Vibrio cholerae]
MNKAQYGLRLPRWRYAGIRYCRYRLQLDISSG